ncbi:MAG: recombination protein RecR [Erysipelotrichaceae bacterium]|nr:MAG: recombination protein [Erysipelotrichaceae bacterium]TXT19927.1 MAG: recombination protein RecR [Erysipelotrichaceae bacterium]
MYPKALQNAIEQLKKLPGVGQKTAERYAFALLNYTSEEIQDFSTSILEAKMTLHPCPICGNLAQNDKCDICVDPRRDKSLICVVQDVKDVAALERMAEYKGLYHVLGGVISTQKGILPEDINLETLIPRLTPEVVEVIIATNPTMDGETTALYLAKRLEKQNCTVSRLAHGIPMGGHVDYADDMTLIKAMEGRKKLK